MTTFSLRSVRIRPGEQARHALPIELEPFLLGGQRYAPDPPAPDGVLTITRTSSGTLFELAFAIGFHGPCFRCLEAASVALRIEVSEYEATDPEGEEELRTAYLREGVLDLSGWARDAIALALPEKILCRDDCAGLCPRCGADLNAGPCTCGPPEPDPRWGALADLRDRLAGS